MKKFIIYLILLLLSFIILNCNSNCFKGQGIKASKGVFDLRYVDKQKKQPWYFEKFGVLRLDGEWEFYWKKFLNGNDFIKYKEHVIFAKVPGNWNGIKIADREIGNYGYATYRLNILFNKNSHEELSLKIPRFISYRLFINGKRCYEIGKVEKSYLSTIPNYNQSIINLTKLKKSKISIVLHVSNFQHLYGGFRIPMYIGTRKQIQSMRDRALFIDAFLVGSFVIMSLYNLSLFFLRPISQIRPALYFGIFCILLVFRSMLTGEGYLYQAFPSLTWNLGIKLDYLSFYIATPVFILFLFSVFPEEEYKPLSIFINYSSFALSAFVLLTKPRLFMHSLFLMHFILLLACLYVFYALCKAIYHKRKSAKLFLSASILFGVFIFHDILVSHNIIHSTLLAPYGLFIFTIFQAYVLASLFSTAYANVEKLSKKLKRKSSKISTGNRKLIKILASSRKMSETYKQIEILQEASSVILTELKFIINPKIKVYYYDIRNREEVFVRSILLGSEVHQEKSIQYDKVKHLIKQINQVEMYYINKTIYIPALQDTKLIGLIKIKSSQIIKIPSDIKSFINTIARSFSLGLANIEYLIKEKVKIRMEGELKTASTVQDTFFSKHSPDVQGLDIYGEHWTASEIGGDWYGYSKIFDDYLYIFIGDVTGHGTSAAMIISAIYSCIRQIENFYFTKGKVLDPSYVHELLHKTVSEIGRGERYMTFFTARLELKTNKMVYTNSAHNFPILVRDNIVMFLDEETNPMLGFIEDYNIESRETWIHKGDLLLFYTDGITEAYNSKEEMYGEERLITQLKNVSHKSSKEIVKLLHEDLINFREKRFPRDDVTLVSCKVLKDL